MQDASVYPPLKFQEKLLPGQPSGIVLSGRKILVLSRKLEIETSMLKQPKLTDTDDIRENRSSEKKCFEPLAIE